ncbi:MAG TPA: nuclear transport factor 2 family protein [Bauldia sp.]|nr:nuclear transport factor 2 family protein [Bauldia sp.]
MNITQEITALEKRFWQSMVDKDTDGSAELVADACLVTGAQGASRITREQFTRMMETGTWELKSFHLKDVNVEQVAKDVAVIAYKVTEDLIVDGKPMKLEAADASTWVRTGDGWRCALHTESVLGDPFGRDRKAA